MPLDATAARKLGLSRANSSEEFAWHSFLCLCCDKAVGTQRVETWRRCWSEQADWVPTSVRRYLGERSLFVNLYVLGGVRCFYRGGIQTFALPSLSSCVRIASAFMWLDVSLASCMSRTAGARHMPKWLKLSSAVADA